MKRFQGFLALLAISFVIIANVTAIDAGDKKPEGLQIPVVKHGPEHKVLESLVGTFDSSVKMYLDPKKPPIETTGVMTRKMILDGNFLQESFQGTFFSKNFTGLGIIGYDAGKKKYVSTWCDSMSPNMSVFHGTYDAAKKTLTSSSEEIEPSVGKKMKARDVLKIISEDEQFFEMYRQPEGADREIKIMEITYKRKSSSK